MITIYNIDVACGEPKKQRFVYQFLRCKLSCHVMFTTRHLVQNSVPCCSSSATSLSQTVTLYHTFQQSFWSTPSYIHSYILILRNFVRNVYGLLVFNVIVFIRGFFMAYRFLFIVPNPNHRRYIHDALNQSQKKKIYESKIPLIIPFQRI